LLHAEGGVDVREAEADELLAAAEKVAAAGVVDPDETEVAVGLDPIDGVLAGLGVELEDGCVALQLVAVAGAVDAGSGDAEADA
jgi:hypothetical protein